MRRALLLLLALALGVTAVHLWYRDNGYVLIRWEDWAFESSLAGFLLLVVGGLLVLWWLLRFLAFILRLPERAHGLIAGRRQRRASRNQMKGLIQIAEGRWREGERLLTRRAEDTETPLVNYLAAARAAQLQGAHQRRDLWLKLAYESTPEATVAVLLTQAELQIHHRQYEQALATLRRLEEESPDHHYATLLMARVYREMEDWPNVEKLLPRLRRQGDAPPERLAELERETYRSLMQSRNETLGDLGRLWDAMPRRLRRDPSLVNAYVDALILHGEHERAEKMARSTLRHRWDPELVLAYGAVAGDATRQLRHVERWIADHGDSAELLLTAARLCMREELWGKARAYLEASIGLRPRADAYALLGKLLEQLGDLESARAAYRAGLDVSLLEPSDDTIHNPDSARITAPGR